MITRLRSFAWLALLTLGAVYVWLLWADIHYTHATFSEFILINWLFLPLPWLLDPIFALGGVWLLFELVRRGAGRLGWRWWCLSLALAHELWDVVGTLERIARSRQFETITTAHPLLAHELFLLAAGPLWVVTAPHEKAVSGLA